MSVAQQEVGKQLEFIHRLYFPALGIEQENHILVNFKPFHQNKYKQIEILNFDVASKHAGALSQLLFELKVLQILKPKSANTNNAIFILKLKTAGTRDYTFTLKLPFNLHGIKRPEVNCTWLGRFNCSIGVRTESVN